MDDVRTTKIGDSLMITGSTKAAVEAALAQLSANGSKILSKVEALGSRWVASCENPEDRIKECEIIKLGMRLMVKGPTEKVVSIKKEGTCQRGGAADFRAVRGDRWRMGGGV